MKHITTLRLNKIESYFNGFFLTVPEYFNIFLLKILCTKQLTIGHYGAYEKANHW